MTRTYDYFCLAYLDILGQKEAFLDNDEYIDTPSYQTKVGDTKFRERLQVAHKNTVMQVERLRETFDDLIKKSKEYVQNSNSPTGIDKNEFDKYKTYNLKHNFFSDSILIFTQISSLTVENDKALLTNIHRLFAACEILMFVSLYLKKPLRGSVEVGLGVKLDDNTIYGPVMCRAHELESKTACYPRIVIGDELLHFLEGQRDNQDNYSRTMAESCLKRTKIDFDGIRIHDYAGRVTREEYSKGGFDNSEFHNPAIQFAKEEYERFKKIPNQKLADRYSRLLNYLIESKTS